MKLSIFNNELDPCQFVQIDYECLLKEWMCTREQYPAARLYKDSICAQNDVTPKTKQEALNLLDAAGDYFILCHAGTPLQWAIAAFVLSAGLSVYAYSNMPKLNQDKVEGSSNNSLSDRQNKYQVNERVPNIYGTVKSIPTLIGSVYRYYKDNVQTEECIMSVGDGWFAIDAGSLKEGETPVNKIAGASASVYEPNQSLISATPQIKIGETFTEYPIVAKQVSSIDGKQNLISPNNAAIAYKGVSFESNKIIVAGVEQSKKEELTWNPTTQSWKKIFIPVYANFTDYFNNNEQIIIEGANYGSVLDQPLSGTTNVSTAGLLTIATSSNIINPDNFKRIKINALTIDDPIGGLLNLAGEYDVASISKTGTYIYEIQLASFADVNQNFSLLTEDGVSVSSTILTKNTDNIDLSGTYTIATVSGNEVVLVNPEIENTDWSRLGELTPAQIANLSNRQVTFRGSAENFIGWYYAGNAESTGFLLNFLAASGIFEGDSAREVAIEVQYQQVVAGTPTGTVYKVGGVMTGRANNRNSIGMTIRENLPFTGLFRFRVKRFNDNGSGSNLIDDVAFESAYTFYQSEVQRYEFDTTVRLRRLAIGSGTNASEFSLIPTSKFYSYATGTKSAERIATNNFADIVIAMALDPYIGRMQLSEVDTAALYNVSNAIAAYLGTPLAREFNYTFDNKNNSYQEMVTTVADAVFCTARRENGLHYFSFERITPNSLVLFNHRNIKPESLTVSDTFGMAGDYDGIEFKWRDAADNYAESVIKLPDSVRTNYKSIEALGITNNLQAHFAAHRAWNKIKFNRQTIEFTAYGEADLVTRKDRIAVVDSTVPIFAAGQVDGQLNKVLTLDYPVQLDRAKSYVIHLQLKSGLVDVIGIASQINDYEIELARIPIIPLVVSGVAHATFSITAADDTEHEAYLIEDKSPSSMIESSITAQQYDSRYYSNDTDFINNLI